MELIGLLRDAVVRTCDVPADSVGVDSTLESLGIDSLAVAEILVELEIALGCELPIHLLRRLGSASTVGDVAGELEGAFAEPAG